MRTRALPAAAGVVLALSATASAAETNGVDRAAGVYFELDGRVLTVRIEPANTRASRRARRQLKGHRVDFVCGTKLIHDVGVFVTHRTRDWPAHRLVVRVRLPRDISRSVDWCLVESARGGGDIAVADMKP